MRLLDKLERKFGRWAIPNLTMVLIAGQALVYFMGWFQPQKSPDLSLIPSRVLEGQVWRLLSFIFEPPLGAHPIIAFFFWYMFYLMGTALEYTWGAFRYNLYLLIGWAATVAASFVVPNAPASVGFLQGSVFLAFAWLYPNFVIFIMFIIPVKIKWVALLTWIYYGLILLFGTAIMQVLVLASIANFLVFFGQEIWWKIKGGRRRMADQLGRIKAKNQARHQCRICGITDLSHPDEDFRYCSKCEGTQCYCSAHLRDHEHVSNDIAAPQR